MDLITVFNDVFEEIFESQFAAGNAPNNIPSSNYTAKLGDDGYLIPNEVGITMITMGTGLNSWTPVLIWDKNTKSFEYDLDNIDDEEIYDERFKVFSEE